MDLALYIHWPFCLKKCPYCDFNSHVHDGIDHLQWQRAYAKACDAIDHAVTDLADRTITSIFFGGGTPSLMPPAFVAMILDHMDKKASLARDIEVTLEANPTSVETANLEAFYHAGINRISLGIQSLNDQDLQFLGREHSAKEARKALEKAASIFERASFDLIYALPDQSLKSWDKELQDALDLGFSHMSLYQLTIEKGTPFFGTHRSGKWQMPSQALAADFYQHTDEKMRAAGLPAYEISNYAQPDQRCRHNESYWLYRDYLGIGPGAHSRITIDGQKQAWMMTHRPDAWLSAIEAGEMGRQQCQLLATDETREERLLMRLRLSDALLHHELQAILDIDDESYQRLLLPLVDEGLLHTDSESVSVPLSGRLLLNQITGYLLTPH